MDSHEKKTIEFVAEAPSTSDEDKQSFSWLRARSAKTLHDLDDVCDSCIRLPPSTARGLCSEDDCPVLRLRQLFETVQRNCPGEGATDA